MAALAPPIPPQGPAGQLGLGHGGPTPLCPRPLLNEWNYNVGGGYLEGRICGNWTANPNARCCLPCPAQDWLYKDAAESFATAPSIAITSLVLCLILLLAYALLPPDRTHRHYLSVGLISSLAIISLAFSIAAPESSQTCADPITPHSIYSLSRCGASGILLQFGALSAGLWAVLTAIFMHYKLVWQKELGKSYMLLSVGIATMVPVIIIGITIATAGYAYGIGGVCAVQSDRSGGLLWGLVVGLSVLGLFIMCLTIAHLWLGRLRGNAHVPTRRSLTLDDGPLAIRRISTGDTIRVEKRGLALSVLLPIEFIIAASIMWATDQGLLHARGSAKIKSLVDCLVANNGQVHLCQQAQSGILPAKSAVAFAMVLTALLGLQTSFILLAHRSLLKTVLYTIAHPVLALRDNRYPPLSQTRQRGTSMNVLSSTSTLPVDKDMAVYKVDQPVGSLRQMGRRPSLAARMRKESETRVMQLSDLHSGVPSPVIEEGIDPYGGARPPGTNPYGYERNRSVVVVDGNPYAHSAIESPYVQSTDVVDANQFFPSNFSMTSPPPAVFTSHANPAEITPWEVTESDRPVSPVSPINAADRRKSWFRESLFDIGEGAPSRPVSPTSSPAMVIAPVPPPEPVATTARMPLRRAATTRAAKSIIPDILRPGLKKTQTEESPTSPRARNASVAIHWGPRDRNGDEAGEINNPLRMNAVEPFRSRRFSQA